MKERKEEEVYKASEKNPVQCSPTEFAAERESLISLIVKAQSMFIMSKNRWTD